MVEDGRMDEGATVHGNDGLLKRADEIKPGKATGLSRGRRRRKRIWLGLALLAAAIAVTAWLLWDGSPDGPRQIVTLPNGEKIQFIGTTYGTNHVLGSTVARLVNQLPSPAANFLRTHLGTHLGRLGRTETGEASLVVWFQNLGTNAPPTPAGPAPSGASVFCTLAGEPDLEAAPSPLFTFSTVDPITIFPVAPRRSPVLQLRFYVETIPDNQPGPTYEEIGRMQFPNPLYGRFPQWNPEPVPAMKKAGDLEVRLEKLMTGVLDLANPFILTNGIPRYNYRPAIQGRDVKTFFDVAFHSPRATNEGWMIQIAELSDATGNVLYRSHSGEWGYFGGTLWPDEAAWRLKLDLKRSSGHSPEELGTFTNVPVPGVGTTMSTPMTNVVNGVEIVLKEFERGPDSTVTGPSWPADQGSTICFEVHSPRDGVAIDLLQIVTDTGWKFQAYKDYVNGGTESTPKFYLKSIPTNAQTLDITWAVQKMRSVEFLVKPPQPE
jgi:hypothetical protein